MRHIMANMMTMLCFAVMLLWNVRAQTCTDVTAEMEINLGADIAVPCSCGQPYATVVAAFQQDMAGLLNVQPKQISVLKIRKQCTEWFITYLVDCAAADAMDKLTVSGVFTRWFSLTNLGSSLRKIMSGFTRTSIRGQNVNVLSTTQNNVPVSPAPLPPAPVPATRCLAFQRVSNKMCVACPVGTSKAAGDLASGPDTFCDDILCAANQYVSNHVCVACPAGSTNVAGDKLAGPNTSCDVASPPPASPQYCAAFQRVLNHVCVACPAGSSRPAGDLPSGPDTYCTATICEANFHVVSNLCLKCPDGSTNGAGDLALGADTACDFPAPVAPPVAPSPLRCTTSAWVEKVACSKKCGGGTKQEVRTVNYNGAINFADIPAVCGASSRSVACNTDPCTVPVPVGVLPVAAPFTINVPLAVEQPLEAAVYKGAFSVDVSMLSNMDVPVGAQYEELKTSLASNILASLPNGAYGSARTGLTVTSISRSGSNWVVTYQVPGVDMSAARESAISSGVLDLSTQFGTWLTVNRGLATGTSITSRRIVDATGIVTGWVNYTPLARKCTTTTTATTSCLAPCGVSSGTQMVNQTVSCDGCTSADDQARWCGSSARMASCTVSQVVPCAVPVPFVSSMQISTGQYIPLPAQGSPNYIALMAALRQDLSTATGLSQQNWKDISLTAQGTTWLLTSNLDSSVVSSDMQKMLSNTFSFDLPTVSTYISGNISPLAKILRSTNLGQGPSTNGPGTNPQELINQETNSTNSTAPRRSCDYTAWVTMPCTKSCGGGSQDSVRVVTCTGCMNQAEVLTFCGPASKTEAGCNAQPCVDTNVGNMQNNGQALDGQLMISMLGMPAPCRQCVTASQWNMYEQAIRQDIAAQVPGLNPNDIVIPDIVQSSNGQWMIQYVIPADKLTKDILNAMSLNRQIDVSNVVAIASTFNATLGTPVVSGVTENIGAKKCVNEDWVEASSCSKSCDGGLLVMTRKLSCIGCLPSEVNSTCGPAMKTVECNVGVPCNDGSVTPTLSMSEVLVIKGVDAAPPAVGTAQYDSLVSSLMIDIAGNYPNLAASDISIKAINVGGISGVPSGSGVAKGSWVIDYSINPSKVTSLMVNQSETVRYLSLAYTANVMGYSASALDASIVSTSTSIYRGVLQAPQCAVGPWVDASDCSKPCQGGVKSQRRSVTCTGCADNMVIQSVCGETVRDNVPCNSLACGTTYSNQPTVLTLSQNASQAMLDAQQSGQSFLTIFQDGKNYSAMYTKASGQWYLVNENDADDHFNAKIWQQSDATTGQMTLHASLSKDVDSTVVTPPSPPSTGLCDCNVQPITLSAYQDGSNSQGSYSMPAWLAGVLGLMAGCLPMVGIAGHHQYKRIFGKPKESTYDHWYGVDPSQTEQWETDNHQGWANPDYTYAAHQ